MKNLTWPHLLVTELMAYLVPIGDVGWSWVEVGVLEIENGSELQRQKTIRTLLIKQICVNQTQKSGLDKSADTLNWSAGLCCRA